MSHTKKELVINAPAKINLFLEVIARREDGYHEIDTVMQTVGLCDRLTVEYDPAGRGIELSCNKKYIPTDSGNIAYRSAEKFLSEYRIEGGVTITLEKHIPVAAGLGGGSTDGAAVLKALNVLTDAGKTTEELCALGAQLGADIPFCIRGGCTRATGIGEVFSPAEALRGVIPVIAIGSRGSSTPAAYKALDDIGYKGTENGERILKALSKGDFSRIKEELYNAFERVILQDNEEVGTIKNRFRELGASAAMMSGSGASVFGLFEKGEEAERACHLLRAEGYFAMVAPLIDRI